MPDYSSYMVDPSQYQARGMQTLLQAMQLRRQRDIDDENRAYREKEMATRDTEYQNTQEARHLALAEKTATRSALASPWGSPQEAGQRVLQQGGDIGTALNLIGQRPPETPGLTGEARNLQLMQGGKMPTAEEYAAFRRQNAPTTTINMPGQQKKFDEELGKNRAAEYAELTKAGSEAWSYKNRLQKAKYLAQNLETGALKPLTTKGKQALMGLGIDISKYGLKDDVPLAEAFKASAVDMTLDAVSRTKGAVSEKEMDLFSQTAPQLSSTPKGNQLIIELADKLAERKVKVAKMARDYVKRTGGFDEGFYDELDRYHEQNPLFDYKMMKRITSAIGIQGAPQSGPAPASSAPPESPYQQMSNRDLMQALPADLFK
jgi:hypothetical protein